MVIKIPMPTPILQTSVNDLLAGEVDGDLNHISQSADRNLLKQYMISATKVRENQGATYDLSWSESQSDIKFVRHIAADTDSDLAFHHLIFRVEGGTANCYDADGDHYDEYYQPPVWVNIKLAINKHDGTIHKRLMMIKSPYCVSKRTFPHDSSGVEEYMFSDPCFGASSDQLASALSKDDLDLVFDLFKHILFNGTNKDDDWGSSWEVFPKVDDEHPRIHHTRGFEFIWSGDHIEANPWLSELAEVLGQIQGEADSGKNGLIPNIETYYQLMSDSPSIIYSFRENRREAYERNKS